MTSIPAFSEAEMRRRRAALEAVMAERNVDAMLVYGTNRAGSGVHWITGWPITREAAVVVRPGERDIMFVQFYNHVPAATRFAAATDVRWGGPSTAATVGELCGELGVGRLGVTGPLGWKAANRIAADGVELVDCGGDYVELRRVKSAEELDWMRRGAELSDAALEAVRDAAVPGVTETQLGAACEAAFLGTGATNQIHYFGVTSMETPTSCVPSQWPSQRPLAAGDVLTCEISASWWGYSGQVLRTMAIGAEPPPLYQSLHEAADAAFDAICGVLCNGALPSEVVAASGVIEQAGFTIYDDLVHGYGGGYFPPILGTASRANEPIPDRAFSTGMTVVVQPNVITLDEMAGVQTGGLVAITDDGVEQLQRVERGFWQV